MASTSSNTAAVYGGGCSDPPSPNTTFVQADPSTFRTIVQKLTGAPDDPSSQKLPISTNATNYNSNRPLPVPAGPKRPAFKLNERRQSAAKNLQINLINNNNNINCSSNCISSMFQFRQQQRGLMMVSPVSTLDFVARMSPRSPSDEEEERAIIAEKGFYNLHPVSPNLISTPRRGRPEPPELLPLFPLRSPKDINQHDNLTSLLFN